MPPKFFSQSFFYLFVFSFSSLLFAQEGQSDSEEGSTVQTKLITSEEQAKTGGAVTRIDEEELQAQEYDDAQSQVQQVPSVVIRTEDGFGLRPNIGIRGTNSDRSKKITLMEDGVLFGPAPYSAPAAYYFPIVNRTTGLEVYKGPAGIRFGPNTIGGALNWLSRPVPYHPTVGFDFNAGNYFTGKAHVYGGVGNDWGGILVEGIGWSSQGFKELDTGGDTGFEKTEFVLKGYVNSDPEERRYHRLNIKLGYSTEGSRETYLGLSEDDFETNPFRRYAASEFDEMNWKRSSVELSHHLEIGPEFELNSTFYRHDFKRVWRRFNGFSGQNINEILSGPTTGAARLFQEIIKGREDSSSLSDSPIIIDNDRQFVSQGFQSEATFKYSEDELFNELKLGFRLHYDSVDRTHTENTHSMLGGRLQSEALLERVVTANMGSTVAIAPYLQNTFSMYGLTIVPGIRIEFVSTRAEDKLLDSKDSASRPFIIPGIASHYSITDELGVVAGVHRGFSPVSPGQDSRVVPESALNYEIGLRYARPDADTLVELIGFLNDYQNLSGACSFAAGCSAENVDLQFNGGEALVKGIEVLAQHKFDIGIIDGGKIPLRVAYSFIDGTFESDFKSKNPIYGDVSIGDRLPYIPTHRGSIRTGIEGENFVVSLTTTFVDAMAETTQDDSTQTDPYILADLLIKQRIWKELWVYAKGENILDAQPVAARRPFGARPLKPVVLQIGISGRFEFH